MAKVAMRLFDNPNSPFCRKVRVVLAETGQDGAVEIVPAAGHPVDSAHMPVAENPLGKIPALIRPDGPALYDSRVICRYLDACAGGETLYPAGRLWEALTLEATGDGIMDAAVLMVYEQRCREPAQRSPDWVEGQWAKIVRALDALESRWMSHLSGRFDIGQIAVGCALGYLDLRLPERAWREGRPALAGWAARMGERASMASTAPATG